MSVLGRRLAATEGAYFLQESKNAAGRRAVQNKKVAGEKKPSAMVAAEENFADVLPEVLRHSIPLRGDQAALPSSLARESKWNISSAASAAFRRQIGAANPLKDFVSLPQVTLGPKRWQLPEEQASAMASTANDLRLDRSQSPVDSAKMKAAAAGITQIGSAFAIATALVFGGAAAALSLAASNLRVQSTDDVRDRGRDLIKPTAEIFHTRMTPLRTWVENNSRKWKSTGKVNDESQSSCPRLWGGETVD